MIISSLAAAEDRDEVDGWDETSIQESSDLMGGAPDGRG